MKKVTATELKINTGLCIETAQKEPVEIKKNGRTVAFLVAREEYDRLSKFENEYWLTRAHLAEKGGYAGAKATANFFSKMLNKNAKS